MSTLQPAASDAAHRLRTSLVLRVNEEACEVWSGAEVRSVGFAPVFHSPRVERVSPGHLVAVATGPDGTGVVEWRWYDAVVLGPEGDGSGSRAYLSAGLPGAEWWVAGSADGDPDTADVELEAVVALYTENALWSTVSDSNT